MRLDAMAASSQKYYQWDSILSVMSHLRGRADCRGLGMENWDLEVKRRRRLVLCHRR